MPGRASVSGNGGFLAVIEIEIEVEIGKGRSIWISIWISMMPFQSRER